MEPTVFIYSLHDPETGHLRYVGWTRHLKKRLIHHFNSQEKCHRGNWLRSLRPLYPLQFVVAEVPNADRIFWERHYIKQARELGFDLVNGTDGGEGTPGRICSDETKKRIGISNSIPHLKLLGRKHSPEARKNMSLGRMGMEFSESHRRALSESAKNRMLNPEFLKKLSDKARGKKASEETRLKMSESQKMAWRNRRENFV